MSDLIWLTEAQMARLRPFFPLSHGKPRVDDRKVLSGIIFINRNGLRSRDAPAAFRLPKTLYNRWVRWSRLGVFAHILTELAAEWRERDTLMIDATHLGAPHGCQPAGQKRGSARFIGRSKGGLNSKLHTVTDGKGRPLAMFLSAAQS